MSTAQLEAVTRGAGVRWVAFDAFRGLAILAMLVDHLTLVLGGPDEIRLTVGRVAMPAFFLLAGYLARSPRLRHLWIGALGFALPLAVPWIDSPNVLVLWAVGVLLLDTLRRVGVPTWLLAAVALTVGANGWAGAPGAYDPWCLWGLMALGAMLPRTAFEWAGRCPRWVAAIGRHPVSWYAGHLLVLQGLLMVGAL